MADIRINSLPTTASASSSDDFLALDGATNGTRKLNAYSPTFGGNLTVSGTGGIQLNSVANLTWGGSFGAGIPTIAIPSATSIGFYPTGSTSGKTFELFGTGAATLAGNLTVSGGQIALDASSSTPSVLVTQTDPAAYSLFRLRNTGGTAQSYDFAVGGSGTGSLAQKFYVYDGTAGAVRLAIAPTTGNLLLGTTTDSGNGKLQLATHNTSAGGIGLGTALSIYRSSDNSAWVDAASGNVQLVLGRAGTANLAVLSDGSNVYASAAQAGMGMIFRTNGSTTALTLDSSQNATFAKNITVSGTGANQIGASGSNLGIGGSGSNNVQVHALGTFTPVSSSDVWAFHSSGTLRPSTANGTVYGFGSNFTADTTSVNVTSAAGMAVYDVGKTGANTLTNIYGIYVRALTGSATNKYAIYDVSGYPSVLSGSITTAAPTSGTAKAWKLGEVASVSPTSPNRTIRVEIDGTVYYIAAKTTND
jgi:hypothetical protein